MVGMPCCTRLFSAIRASRRGHKFLIRERQILGFRKQIGPDVWYMEIPALYHFMVLAVMICLPFVYFMSFNRPSSLIFRG